MGRKLQSYRRHQLRRAACLLGLATVVSLVLASPALASAHNAAAASPSWTVYHGNPAGTGDAAGIKSVNTASRAWTSPTLAGQLYGQPLVLGDLVYVATEEDNVYALSAATGKVAWRKHLGRPVPAVRLPCGDIGPTVGITGTPVIDRSRHEIFVVADEMRNGRPAHMLVGLSTSSGRREMSKDVDPRRQVPADILQRTGLTLDHGHVYFGYGGNFGDCATYRGRLGSVAESGGRPRFFTVDAKRGESQGAIWMGGAAPAVGHGDLWVSTGNGSVFSSTHAYDDGDGVLKISPSLRLRQYFAPADWATNNSEDLDMSIEPVLLPDGQVILSGKSDIVYLLNGAHLGGIGKQQATLNSGCDSVIDGGSAIVGMTVYLPCATGIIAVRATKSPPRLRQLWSTGTGGGPPIVAGGLVWTIGQNGTLYGLAPRTGKIRQQTTIGVPANHFPTPGIGDGLLLAPAARDVVAFRTSATSSGTAVSAAAAVAKSGRTFTPVEIGLAGLVAVVVFGWFAWLVRRQRQAQRAGIGYSGR